MRLKVNILWTPSRWENTYKILPQYFSNTNPIFHQIKDWFKLNFEGWEIRVKEISSSTSRYEVVLSNSKIKDIGIESTGSGIKQSLPLIVRSYMPITKPTLKLFILFHDFIIDRTNKRRFRFFNERLIIFISEWTRVMLRMMFMGSKKKRFLMNVNMITRFHTPKV